MLESTVTPRSTTSVDLQVYCYEYYIHGWYYYGLRVKHNIYVLQYSTATSQTTSVAYQDQAVNN